MNARSNSQNTSARSPKTQSLLLTAAFLGLTSAASASIGLNFVDTGDAGVQNGASDALGAGEVAGVAAYQQGNWNNLGRWGQGVSLNNHLGVATSVSATWDSANTWNAGTGASTPNNKLMHGYLDSTFQQNWVPENPYQFWWNENKPDVYLTGLSSWLAGEGGSSYNVVIYADGDAAAGRISEYWLQSVTSVGNNPPTALGSDLSSHVFLRDAANFSGDFTQVPLSANSAAAPGDGNYIVFTGLTADEFVLRTEDFGWTDAFRTVISGVQIVSVVPEPGTLALLGLGGLGLVLMRQRS